MKREPSKSRHRRSAPLKTQGRATRGSTRGIVEPAPRMRVHRERRKQAIRRWTIGIGIGLVALIAVGAAATYLWFNSLDVTMSKAALSDVKLSDALAQRGAKATEPFTILLTGSDARPGEQASRADTIILAKVDPKQKKVWMLSIPRDTRVNIPGHGYDKINSAKFYGGADGGNALLVKTVTEFTGIPINYYMDVSFDGFKAAVDALGGVFIDVDVKIDDRKAAGGTPVSHQAQLIEPGYQKLDGEHALTYVRSRDFPDADFTRMKHQQAFFRALATQMTKPGNFFKIPTVVNSISKNVATTMPMGDIISAAQALQGIAAENIQTATIVGEWRSPFVWVDEERKAELIKIFTEGGSFDAPASTATATAPSSVSVTVRNGAGQEGVALSASTILKGAGFKVSEVGNANQFVYDKTLVVYKDNKAAADLVANALPAGSVIASRGMYDFSTDVLVVVGKDWKAALETSKTVQ